MYLVKEHTFCTFPIWFNLSLPPIFCGVRVTIWFHLSLPPVFCGVRVTIWFHLSLPLVFCGVRVTIWFHLSLPPVFCGVRVTIWFHLSLPPVFCGVRVTRSLVLCVMCVDRCLFFVLFSFGHCVLCSLIYGFLLPLWYLQTLLIPFYGCFIGAMSPSTG